jgi:UDP-N-acetylglucosamine 1-carboxyvinyltransferase
MGAEIDLEQGSVHARTKGLSAARIYFDFPSVGATENIMMTASLTPGETMIENAAREPEIVNLACALRSMGADVEGEGTGTIRVRGVEKLGPASVKIIPDRIEASTYLLAGVMTRGDIQVREIDTKYMEALLFKLEEAGIPIETSEESVSVHCVGIKWKGVTLKTLPYPGFPTDLQPQIMAALCMAEGTSVIHESVFDSRYMHVGEFKRMGCKIDIQGNTVVITGVPHLVGAEVIASDLRAGAALILLGLAAEGESVVCALRHVWRGYERLMDKMASIGADIELLGIDEANDEGCGGGN